MEKFGVEQEEPNDKVASSRSHIECPRCKRTLRPTDETGVLLCPQCGSKPFEATHGAR